MAFLFALGLAASIPALSSPGATPAQAQLADELVALEHPAFAYREPATRNPVSRLAERMQAGKETLRFEPETGYLRALLQALDVPVESQIAVFAGASLQGRSIRASNPRALYFNDAVAVGWVPNGFIEIAAHDADKGAVFFRLLQAPAFPTVMRDNGCLQCHNSATTMGVPGFIARSVPAATDGTIMPWLGNYLVDHRTPMANRWGGWYVTGKTAAAHLGNAPLADKRLMDLRPSDAGPVLQTLGGRVDTTAYLSAHSDVVALLVFDHQMRMMNLLARLGAEARTRPTASLTAAVREVVDYMLFVDEAPLGPTTGSSGFAKIFSARGPRDSKGRSLRDLDLTRRLMKYPCSYLIYSEAFDGLPSAAKTAIYVRLADVLEGRDKGPRYARLSAADRTAVLEILRDTKRDF